MKSAFREEVRVASGGIGASVQRPGCPDRASCTPPLLGPGLPLSAGAQGAGRDAQVDLPEDPNLKGFSGSKPAFVVSPSGASDVLGTPTDAGAPAALHPAHV